MKRNPTFQWSPEVEAIASVLRADAYYGPLYVCNADDAGDSVTINGETVYYCGWGEESATSTIVDSKYFPAMRALIKDAIDEHPRFWDSDADCWADKLDEWYECPECCGHGELSDPNLDPEEDDMTCPYCDGSKQVPEFLEHWCEYERSDLAKELLGEATYIL